MASGAISQDNTIFELFVGGKSLSFLGEKVIAATGGLKQWFRYGKSFSNTKNEPITRSIRWGASPKHANKIRNENLRNINQKFRQTKLPGNNRRVNDKGHFHLKK